MSKEKSKRWWIVREDGNVFLKLLSWKDVKSADIVKKFHWAEESPSGGHSYLSYLREKGVLS